MNKEVVEVRADGRQRVRRGYGEGFKRRLVAMTLAPGASVARIALEHGVNANLLFTWRRQLSASGTSLASRVTPPLSKMLPVTIEPREVEVNPKAARAARRNASKGCIEVEVGARRVRLHGAVDLPTLAAVLRMLGRGP
jgi:transposase